MDQIKAQLAVVMKYGFWISSVVVLFGAVGVWYWTTGNLIAESEAQTTKIKGAIQQVASTRDELPTLPNDLSHVEMERMIAERQDEVLESWQTLYERQREILKWPTGVLTDALIDEYKDRIPIEIYYEHPTAEEDELETTLRSQYATYIEKVLPNIASIAKTEWKADFNSAGMGMGMDSMMGGGYGGPSRTSRAVDITGAQEGPLVAWDSSSQQSVLADLFPWRGSLPTTLDVYYSQENLWILRQLMQIVADVNGDAVQPYQAKIREIRQIGIGKSVKFGAGTITAPGTSRMGMMGGMEMEMEFEMDFSDMGMEMEGGESESPDPAENRYVNAAREPIEASRLRSALTSNSPSDAALAVAKRVPVMMSVVMDQRAVPEFVAACGSAPLMVEVTQVRVLPKKATAGGGMMGGGDMDMDMEGGGMEEEMMMGGMGGGMMGGGMASPTAEPAEEFPLDMAVEVYGIIYIYNPPDPEKLGVEQVTEDTVIEGTSETMGGQAVDTPPTTTTPTPPADAVLPQPGDTTTPPADTSTPPDAATPPDVTTPPDATTPPTDPDGTAPVTSAGATPPTTG